MRRLIITDTSCLIIFDKIDGFWILQKVYDEVITTNEVKKEFGKPLPSWIKTELVKDIKYQKFLETQLDLGESSAIALAAELENSILILDDLKARKFAKRLGFRLTGSLGILNKARQMGLIDKIKPFLDKLKETDFRISDNIINDLLDKNNE